MCCTPGKTETQSEQGKGRAHAEVAPELLLVLEFQIRQVLRKYLLNASAAFVILFWADLMAEKKKRKFLSPGN